MGFMSLALFITGMWAMILAIAAFLVAFVAPIEMYLFGGQAERMTLSIVQASIAIIAIIIFIFGLNRLKRMYLQKKLQ
jgi:Na+/melibiose symporter-like transporter